MTILVQQQAEIARLRVESAKLKGDLQASKKLIMKLSDALKVAAQKGADLSDDLLKRTLQADQLKADNTELRRDAERYRWLRNSAPSRLAAGPVVAMAKADGSLLERDDGHEMLLGREDADAAIDQAMTKGQQP